MTIALDLDRLDFAKGGGLVTVVAQDAATGQVLMVAHADREALERTLETGEMHYRSRSRGLWRKGATSGHVQRVVALAPDCDGDAVLALVDPAGPACHTGSVSCFGPARRADVLDELDATIAERKAQAQAGGASRSYTVQLLRNRNQRLKKIGEEAAELVLAAGEGDRERTVEEAADLFYHTLVAVQAAGGSLAEVRRVLAGRRRPDPGAGAS